MGYPFHIAKCKLLDENASTKKGGSVCGASGREAASRDETTKDKLAKEGSVRCVIPDSNPYRGGSRLAFEKSPSETGRSCSG